MQNQPPSPIPPVPVICDSCRAEGAAGDPAFSAIPDILAFDPVPRRAHVNNWTAEHQRAFIAALAITGSPRQAARALGRHMFGAQQLRTARGGKGFSEAWDAALDIARDREFARIRANLSDLASEADAADARSLSPSPLMGVGWGDGDDEDGDSEARYGEALANIGERLLRARRLYLLGIHSLPEARAAWEVLVGPTDWDKAAKGEPQANEHLIYGLLPSMSEPDMLLTAEAGLLPELTGSRDALAEVRQALLPSEPRVRSLDQEEQ